jgi:pyruvate formate lyase activating enzyme
MLSRNNQKAENLYHVFVSNGFMSCETAEFIIAERLIDAINIDLKFIESGKYKRICGGKPGPVLENIARFFDAGIHIEITNLIIPDENDGKEDIERLCAAIAAISKEIPLHFSRFYPQ